MDDIDWGEAADAWQLPDAFRPGARYFSAMDCAIYLKEDCSYRAARVSRTLSLLLAPYDDAVVGVKIKGVRHLAENLFAILEDAGHPLEERDRVQLTALLRMAVVSDEFAEQALSEAEVQRRQQLEKRAQEFLSKIGKVEVEISERQAAFAA